MDAVLADRRSFLLGSDVTLADLIILPVIVRAEDVGLERLWADRPAVAGWYARMQARSSFGTVFGPAGTRLRAVGGKMLGDRTVAAWPVQPKDAAVRRGRVDMDAFRDG